MNPFIPGKSIRIATSGAAELTAVSLGDGTGEQLLMYNAGPSPLAYALGGASVAAVVPTTTATAGRTIIAPGAVMVVGRNPGIHTHISIIRDGAVDSVLYVTEGTGE